MRGHLTPGEAGEHGRDARARRLVVTHVSDELGEDWAREEAERHVRRDRSKSRAKAPCTSFSRGSRGAADAS